MMAHIAGVAFTGETPTAGAVRVPAPFVTFDPHLVLLAVLLGYVVLYVALVAIDSVAPLLQAGTPPTDDEGRVEGNGVEVPGGPE